MFDSIQQHKNKSINSIILHFEYYLFMILPINMPPSLLNVIILGDFLAILQIWPFPSPYQHTFRLVSQKSIDKLIRYRLSHQQRIEYPNPKTGGDAWGKEICTRYILRTTENTDTFMFNNVRLFSSFVRVLSQGSAVASPIRFFVPRVPVRRPNVLYLSSQDWNFLRYTLLLLFPTLPTLLPVLLMLLLLLMSTVMN